jgi:hypothetical protein
MAVWQAEIVGNEYGVMARATIVFNAEDTVMAIDQAEAYADRIDPSQHCQVNVLYRMSDTDE